MELWDIAMVIMRPTMNETKKILYIIYNYDSSKNHLVDTEWMEKFDKDHGYSWSEEYRSVESVTLGELTALFRKYKKKYPKLHTASIYSDRGDYGIIQLANCICLELETNG